MTTTALAKATGRSAVEGTTDMKKVQPLLAKLLGKVPAFRRKAEEFVIRTEDDVEIAAKHGRDVAEFVESIERQRREFVDPLNTHVKKVNSDFKGVSNELAPVADIWRKKIGDWHIKQREIAAAKAAKRQIELDVTNGSLEFLTTGEFAEKIADWEARSRFKVDQEDGRQPLTVWERTQLEKARDRIKKLRDAAAAEERRLKLEEDARRKAAAAARAKKTTPKPAPKESELEFKLESPETPRVEVQAAEPPKTIGTSSVRMRWTFEEREGEHDVVPPEYMSVDKAKVNSAIRDAVREGRIEDLRIPGLDIKQVPDVAL